MGFVGEELILHHGEAPIILLCSQLLKPTPVQSLHLSGLNANTTNGMMIFGVVKATPLEKIPIAKQHDPSPALANVIGQRQGLTRPAQHSNVMHAPISSRSCPTLSKHSAGRGLKLLA